jgi:hypothetical protein
MAESAKVVGGRFGGCAACFCFEVEVGVREAKGGNGMGTRRPPAKLVLELSPESKENPL